MNRAGWINLLHNPTKTVATLPADERARHAATFSRCACNVRVRREFGWTFYNHQAFDHREVDEYLLARRG